MIYRLGPDWPASAAQLEEALAREPFAPCSATQQKSTGWVPPRGHEHGALVEVVDGQWLACLAMETKSVPADAVLRKAQEAAAHIEQTSGRVPGKREMRELREDALQALLPQAFARRSQVRAWIHPGRRWLVLDAGSQARADELISALVRVAGQGFAVQLLHTRRTPQAAMAAWLASDPAGPDDELPENFAIGRECELKGSGDEPALVRFARHELRTEEVRQHIAEGKLPTRLALNWQDRIDLVLTQALELKKIRFDEGLFDAIDADEDRFDADVAMGTAEFEALIDDLIEALDGEMTELGHAAAAHPATGPAPVAAAAATATDEDPPF